MTTKSKSAFILLSVLLIGAALGALASGTLRQQRQHRLERMPPHERFLAFVESVVQPTPEQREDFDRIIATRSEQLREVLENHQTQIIAIHDSLRVDLQAVLNEEQRRHFEEQIVKGSHKLAKSRIERLTEDLDLNEDQQQQISKILAEFKHLPRPDRKHIQGNWQQRRRMFGKRIQKMHEEIEAVLTEEQKQKYRELRMRRRHPFEGQPGPPPFKRSGRNFRN